jgi:hypothetical protein
MYSLRRESDGAGDSGPVSLLLWEEDGELKTESDGKPRVGVAIQVGSLTARSYQYQDYWQTTYITEILEEKENYVRFKTTNSIYEWRG